MRNTTVAALSLALSTALALVSGPARAAGQGRGAVTVRRVLNQAGWEIPGLSVSEVLDKRHPLPSGYGVQSVPLQITVLKPKREVAETVSLYGSKDGGETVVVRQRRVAVRSIIKCDVNNKVFLYIVQVANLVSDSGAASAGTSGLFGLLYYDDDGDGIFETRESGPPAVTPDLRIPDWVKNP